MKSRKQSIAIMESMGFKNVDYDKLQFLQANISRAKARIEKHKTNTLTKFDVYAVGEKQKWKCAISGQPLEFTRGGTHWQNKWCNPMSCVIDRIDSSKDYTIDNIQLATHKANTWKSDFTNEELAELSSQFLKMHKKKK